MSEIRDIVISRLMEIGRVRLAEKEGQFWDLSTEIMDLYPPFSVHRSQVMLLIASCMGEAFPQRVTMQELQDDDNA